MALDGRRAFDWEDGAIDRRFALRPLTVGLAAGGPSFRETAARLELPATSVVAGSLAALLYGAPVLFIANIFTDFGPRLLATILGAGAFVGSLATWRITASEQKRWQHDCDRLSDHADPPPWK